MHAKETIEDYSNQKYENTIEPIIGTDKNNLYLIHDTSFINIRMESDSNMIRFTDSPTFYITSCLFQSYACSNPMIYLKARACTFLHICCSNPQQIGDEIGKEVEEGLFLFSDAPTGTFFKFIYSTLYSNLDEEIRAKYVVHFKGTCSMRYQCNNITKFNTKSKNDGDHDWVDRYCIMRIVSPDCFIMTMNTFETLRGCKIIEYNNQAQKSSYQHYFNKLNIMNVALQDCCILLNMNQDRKTTIEDFIFLTTNTEENPVYLFIIAGQSDRVTVLKLVFNKEPNKDINYHDINYHNINYNDYIVQSNPVGNVLAYYTVVGVCDGVFVTDAY